MHNNDIKQKGTMIMIAIHVDPVKLLSAAELASYAHRHQKRSARDNKDKLQIIN